MRAPSGTVYKHVRRSLGLEHRACHSHSSMPAGLRTSERGSTRLDRTSRHKGSASCQAPPASPGESGSPRCIGGLRLSLGVVREAPRVPEYDRRARGPGATGAQRQENWEALRWSSLVCGGLEASHGHAHAPEAGRERERRAACEYLCIFCRPALPLSWSGAVSCVPVLALKQEKDTYDEM